MNNPRNSGSGACAILLGFAIALFASASCAQARSLPDFADLAEQVAPAVVNISTRPKTGAGPGSPPDRRTEENDQLDEFYRKFFGEDAPGHGNGPNSSLGSGFIIDADGYVISNYHVVRDAAEIIVRMQDRREFVAQLIGSDEASDLAVLKIKASELPVVRLGQAEKLRVGEWVLAIGAPFGFEHSVTAGIVSAKGRSLPDSNYTPFIQTDVAINPGNSGGPLFNLDGEVVGVNSQIFSRTGGFMGLSFAIPTEVAVNVYQQLRASGAVIRGWLGVLIQDVNLELSLSLNMSKPQGALISRVLPDSPAESAGLREGDVVLGFGKEQIDFSADLPPLVGNSRVGESVPLRILRAGQPVELSVRIGRLPPPEDLRTSSRESRPQKTRSAQAQRLGIRIAELSKQQRLALNLEPGDRPAGTTG